MAISDLRTQANQVKNEVNDNQNTATRVGTVLVNIVEQIAADPAFKGIATPSSSPDLTDGKKSLYIAREPGTYMNFGNKTVAPGEIRLLTYNGTSWSSSVLFSQNDLLVDDKPTPEGANLITSGAVFNETVKPLFATRSNGLGRIKELYMTGLSDNEQYFIGSLRYISGIIGIQVNVSLDEETWQSVASASVSYELNNKIIYLQELNESGISGYCIVDIKEEDTQVLSPYPDLIVETVSNIDNSPRIKAYLNAGINTIIPLVSVHDSYSDRPSMNYGDYFIEGRSLYCQLSSFNVYRGRRIVSYKNKLYVYDNRTYDKAPHALHEVIIGDEMNYQNLLMNTTAGVNGTDIPITIPDASQMETGYYDDLGGKHSVTAYRIIYLPISIGVQYCFRGILQDEIGIVAVDSNKNPISNIKKIKLYSINTSASNNYYMCEALYNNTRASYIALSVKAEHLQFLSDSYKLYKSDPIETDRLFERAVKFNAIGAAAQEIPVNYPASFDSLNVGYYTKTGTYGEHNNFRHIRVPISAGKKYYIECYIRSNLGIVSLDSDGNVVDVIDGYYEQVGTSLYSFSKAVYVNRDASYLALSIQNTLYTIYPCNTRIIESIPTADDEIDGRVNDISIGSVFARLNNTPLKIAFYGDSTYDGVNTTGYTGHAAWDEEHGGMGVTEYVCEKAFPYLLQQKLRTTFGNSNLTCYNVGYSGKYASWGNDNFSAIFGGAYSDSDIIVIGFGINDRLYHNNNINNLRMWFKVAMLSIIEKVRALGKTPVLMTAQAGWQFAIKDSHQGTTYDKMTFSYIPACVCDEVKRDIAREESIELIDLNTFDYNLLLSSEYNPLQICSDSLHFGDLGHEIESCWLSKVFNSRTQELGSGQRITYINEMVKSDFIMDVDFANDSEWYKKLSITAASTDLSKEAMNICIFMKESCTMTAVGTNVAVIINGTASTTVVRLDAYRYYNVVVFPAATGAVEFKGFVFS